MNLSHLVTCCTLRWEVVAEQTTFFLSTPLGLAEEHRKSRSDSVKHSSTIPAVRQGLCRLYLMGNWTERVAEPQRKFPLSAKLQMEDLPTETLAADALLTHGAAKEKGLWRGCSCPFSRENTRLGRWQRLCLGGRTLWEGPVRRVSGKFWPRAGGWDWLLAQRFSVRHDNTLKESLIHVFFAQGFYRNPCLTKRWIQI